MSVKIRQNLGKMAQRRGKQRERIKELLAQGKSVEDLKREGIPKSTLYRVLKEIKEEGERIPLGEKEQAKLEKQMKEILKSLGVKVERLPLTRAPHKVIYEALELRPRLKEEARAILVVEKGKYDDFRLAHPDAWNTYWRGVKEGWIKDMDFEEYLTFAASALPLYAGWTDAKMPIPIARLLKELEQLSPAIKAMFLALIQSFPPSDMLRAFMLGALQIRRMREEGKHQGEKKQREEKEQDLVSQSEQDSQESTTDS